MIICIHMYIWVSIFSRGPRYVLVEGGALAYPRSTPRSIGPKHTPKQTPQMIIIFEGLLMVVVWKSWVATLHAAFRRPLRHPALHPRSLAAMCRQVG